MGLLQRLEMLQGQPLVVTPQLLQSTKPPQASPLALVAYVEADLERTPLLERADADGDLPDDKSPSDSRAERADSWIAEDLDPGRSELARETDAGLDNVFPAEMPVSAREA